MDELKLSHPTLIVLTGLPGAGKSWFAREFADTFGSPIVSLDQIRWTLFANHTYSDNENAMVYQIAELLLAELLKTKRSLILDGGYNTFAAREELFKIARRAGYEILTVIVQTDEKSARLRATHRDGRRLGDRFNQPLSSEEFAKQSADYQPPVASRTSVVISGKHTFATQARAVLKKMLEIQPPKPATDSLLAARRSAATNATNSVAAAHQNSRLV